MRMKMKTMMRILMLHSKGEVLKHQYGYQRRLPPFGFSVLQRFLRQRFSVWLYHGVVGNPCSPPSWTLARTRGWTPLKTSVSGPRSVVSTQYSESFQEPHRPKTPAMLSQSMDLYVPSYEVFEIEEVLDEPHLGSKFANPWLRDVAMLSWRTGLKK